MEINGNPPGDRCFRPMCAQDGRRKISSLGVIGMLDPVTDPVIFSIDLAS